MRASAAAVLFWPQAQRDAGFSVMDSLFPARVVRKGVRTMPLPTGAPLAAFAPGGAQAALLDQYMAEQKVAGIVIVVDGKVRLERYAMGYNATKKWTSFSVAKSMTSTLVGAAIRDGYITSIDDPVTKYIASMKGSAYDSVSIRQLLTMTSGVKWNEDYTDPKSDVAMLFALPPDAGLDQTVSYMRKLPREAPAGTKWVYKTGETNLIGNLVMEATHKTLADYLSEKVWKPVGMELDASWLTDQVGHEAGGCCLQVGLRDYARIGVFVMNGAKVNGAAIVPDGWLEAGTRNQVTTGDPMRGYGYQWWTETEGRFNAIGIFGQSIHIDPARKLVVAINSSWPVATGRAQSIARAALWKAIAEAVDAER
jgi:CubicO group peptidase (beta-lactamase class C family)